MKSKVIIALVLACFALFMAWGVSRVAFKEMLNTVESISAPSERLRIVNVISRKISALDQLQKEQALSSPENYRKGFKASGQLKAVLDTLADMYVLDSAQLSRIRAIKKLLNDRDKQFVNYLKVRERMVNNNAFSEQVKNISSIVSKNTGKPDSTVLATEEKTSTTTIYPTEEKSRGFFGKIFGRKKPADNKAIKIVSEEKVRRDTISLSAEEKLTGDLERSLQFIETEQRRENASFLKNEAVLARANNQLILQMQNLLRQVENEVVAQIETSSTQANRVVNTGISTISLIMLVFVVLTGVLLYLILTDITKSAKYRNELELARDEAEYHGKAKQRFLSNMSHEIRTPLQSIIGYADMISQQDHPDRKHIEAIHHSSEHLLQIVNEVLDYNRIISGKFTFRRERFDIQSLIDEVVSVVRPNAGSKSLALKTELDFEGIKYINGDPFRLKQILYNLLGNAIKFTMSGEIVLSSFYKRKGDDLYFTFNVKDTGIGLTEAECSTIFNEFEQGTTTRNDHNAGTGLGLAIIKALVENQGGRIYVKSKPGAGSIFTVLLTFSVAEAPEVPALKAAQKSITGDMVWIVDDDQLILDLCSIIFSKHDIPYKSFSTPSQLLNEDADPSLKYIFMDIRMPEMDGIQLCSILRQSVGDKVKIYAITAQVLPDERDFLLNNGFDGLLMKPFREAELLAALSIDAARSLPDEEEADFSALRKMTFGDEEQLERILRRFRDDCRNDIEEMKQALSKGDLSKAALVIHRLAGRIAQVGYKRLAAEFRTCETALRKEKTFSSALRKDVASLLDRLDQLCHSIS